MTRRVPRRVRGVQHPRTLQQPGARLPVRQSSPCSNLALIGAASFLIFIVAAISQAVSALLPARRSVTAGLPLLLICLAMLEAALFAKALWLFLAGTVIGGVAVGLIFRGGLSELNRLADPRHRAAVVSTFFAAAYLGLGLPAVLTGRHLPADQAPWTPVPGPPGSWPPSWWRPSSSSCAPSARRPPPHRPAHPATAGASRQEPGSAGAGQPESVRPARRHATVRPPSWLTMRGRAI